MERLVVEEVDGAAEAGLDHARTVAISNRNTAVTVRIFVTWKSQHRE